jgi:HlyD family secretion protein
MKDHFNRNTSQSDFAESGDLTFGEGLDGALLTEEVQEVISYRPHWIVRSGNTLFLLIMLMIVCLTWVIKYPDIINSSAHLVTLNPPKLLNAKVSGKLEQLFIANEQEVKKGQHLGLIESTTDYYEMMQLYKWVTLAIDASQNQGYDYLQKNSLPVLHNLGELQTNYQLFQNQLEITKQTLTNGYYQQKRKALQKDLQYLGALKNSTNQQKNLQQQDQRLEQKEFDAYESLAKEKVIAPLELHQYKSKILSREQSLEQLNAQLTNSEISQLGKQKEILDLEKQVKDQHQQYYSALLELKSEIQNWIQQYVLLAPEDGKLLFSSSLQRNEWVENGQDLFYIQPPQSQFYIEMMAGQKGFGKIKIGQRVVIRVNGYPSTEFGYLTATVNYISKISKAFSKYICYSFLVFNNKAFRCPRIRRT